MKKDTAVLICGTFNPITNAHIALGFICHKKYPDADIIYVPSNTIFMSDWKQIKEDSVFNTSARLNLLYETLRKHKYFRLSTIEVDETVDGRTYNTVLYYKKQYENIILCFGADKLEEMEKWYKFDKLSKLVDFLIVDRDIKDLREKISRFNKKYPNRFKGILTKTYAGISSTKVRLAFYSNNLETIKNDVPLECYNYLEKKLKETA